MPSVQIYLNEELFEFVKANKSKTVQQALKELKEKLELQSQPQVAESPA